MKLAILGPSEEKIGYSTKKLIEEGKKVFDEVVLIPALDVKLRITNELDAVYKGKSLRRFDYILPRIDSKRAVVGYPIVRFLDYFGTKKPYPAETILITHNKFLTLERLVRGEVRVPETYLTASKKSAREVLNKMKLPIILKLLSGFGGMGVMFMESKEAARSALDTLKTLQQEVCMEKYIENPGEDIRGVVAGNEVIASYRRVAAPEEKRANIHAGGRGEAFTLTEEMNEIVLKSAQAVGSKICAVDMIRGSDGVYVTEVNINPGLEGIEKTTNINVAQRIINYINSELKK